MTEGKLYVGDTVAELSGGRVYIYDAATGDYSGMVSHITQQNGFFGDSIVVGGSYVFVGAEGEHSEGITSYDGRVYVYKDGEEVATLTSPNPTAARFGGSIACDGNKVIIGAPGELDGSGRAYVYSIATIEDELVGPVEILESPNPPSGNFGDSVAIDNGLIVIGASGEFVLSYGDGRVYIYSPG